MKKIALLTLALAMTAQTAWAFTGMTILSKQEHNKGTIPFVDAVQEVNLQKNMNSELANAAGAVRKEAGGKATSSYTITMNKPTLFSVIIKAQGNKNAYRAMNMDITTGKEDDPKDFFYIKDGFRALVPNDDYAFAEDGLLLRSSNAGPYDKKVTYKELMPFINIANAGRFLPSYKVTVDGAGHTLRVQAGTMVDLYLKANPTTGYDWYVTNAKLDNGMVTMGNSFFLPSDKRGMTGAPGMDIFVVGFQKPGNYTLKLEYKRPWVNKPVDKVEYHFIVE
ncbi:MAG: protease inhibitor I42 family protein [Acidaminococcaceae bacterium]|nr:protease inhibitor I42 family protein [Acidaminococcaceae bacterium]